MTVTVSDVLDERLRRRDGHSIVGTLVSAVLHASFIAVLILIAKPRRVLDIPQATPVRIVSGGQLARSRPQQLTVPKPEAKPEPAGKRVIEKAKEEVLKPTEKAMPLPAEKKPPKVEPEKVSGSPKAAATPEIEAPTVGATTPAVEGPGTTSFGTSVSAFDSDFPFAYYVEQLLTLVGQSWLKPSVPDPTYCVVFFRIDRSGQITGINVERASGLPYYDREATRALYRVNPVPPLPPEYRGENLGVHLRFQ